MFPILGLLRVLYSSFSYFKYYTTKMNIFMMKAIQVIKANELQLLLPFLVRITIFASSCSISTSLSVKTLRFVLND